MKDLATGSSPATPEHSIVYGSPPRSEPPRVLMIHPKFMAGSFWSFEKTAEIYGCAYPQPPLGLATVAAMLPADWPVRLLDRNIETVTDADIDAADLIMTGGMLPQRGDILTVIRWAQARGKKVAVGGPDIMSSSHVFAEADFLVVGEAESMIDDFIAAWRDGAESGRFDAERFKADVTQTPIPRFDLLSRSKYAQITVQYSRGCPFTCEFCDIIELFGRRPRAKTNEQMLAELQRLYDLGHRGHINFVDDNIIGNKKAVKLFLPELIRWQKERNYPFDFSTEASINMADDTELMQLMSSAGFTGVFIGIESPDEDVLKATKKKQNTKRNIAHSIHKVYAHGMGVMAGFIVGFDEEKGRVGAAVSELIEECAIPIAMVGLLYALPETELSRRLEKEGRLYPHADMDKLMESGSVDQCVHGLNFETRRPRREILEDYREVVAHTYDLDNYHRRVRKMADYLKFDHAKIDFFRSGFLRNMVPVFRLCWALGLAAPEGKRLFWGTLLHAVRRDPRNLEIVMLSLAAYAHLGPFSKSVLGAIDGKIAESQEPAALVAAE